MQLWRLSTKRHARDFSGGYGLPHSGRWNTRGRPITYCSTVPSLTALEKRVHVTDAFLLPPLILVEYEAPDDIPLAAVDIADLPEDWISREVDTQQIVDRWPDSVSKLAGNIFAEAMRGPSLNVLLYGLFALAIVTDGHS
jgi:RES domain-containing protein